MKTRPVTSLAIGLALAVFPALAAGQPVPLGPPFQVNTSSGVDTGVEGPSLAAGIRGNFVAAWHGGGRVFARTFDSNGAAPGGERAFGVSAGSSHPDPDLSAGADGAYVATWTRNGRVLSRRFRPDGVAMSEVLPAAPEQAAEQFTPAVAKLSTAGHVVIWAAIAEERFGTDLFGRLYGHRGRPLGPPFLVNRGRFNSQFYPEVAPLPDGGFMVVWQTFDISGIPTKGIFLRRFNRFGEARGAEVRVDSGTGGVFLHPEVATSSRTGETVVVWESHDSFGHGIFLRRFNAVGQPLGDEVQVNTGEVWHQFFPSVAMSPEGDFVVVWTTFDFSSVDVLSELRARWFGQGGVPAGDDFRVDDPALGSPAVPAVAMDGAGNFTVVWTNFQESSETLNLLARRFAAP